MSVRLVSSARRRPALRVGIRQERGSQEEKKEILSPRAFGSTERLSNERHLQYCRRLVMSLGPRC